MTLARGLLLTTAALLPLRWQPAVWLDMHAMLRVTTDRYKQQVEFISTLCSKYQITVSKHLLPIGKMSFYCATLC